VLCRGCLGGVRGYWGSSRVYYVSEHLRLSRKWSSVSPCTMAAEAGLPRAMFNLGVCIRDGEQGVVAPDYPTAADWFRRAADAGHGEAAMCLSSMYILGRGRPRRLCLPRSVFRPSCQTLEADPRGRPWWQTLVADPRARPSFPEVTGGRCLPRSW